MNNSNLSPIMYGDTPVKAFSVHSAEGRENDYYAAVYDPQRVKGEHLYRVFFAQCRTFEKVCKALTNKGYQYQSQESLINGLSIFRFNG